MSLLEDNVTEAQRFVLTYENASLTASLTAKLAKPSKRFTIDAVKYVNPTGLAEDVANFFEIEVQIDPDGDATQAAHWSTETGEDGTIAADTFIDIDRAADLADVVGQPNDEIAVVFTETGTATLPPGRLQIECSYR